MVPSLGVEFVGVGAPDCWVAVDYEGHEVEGCSGGDERVGDDYGVCCCSGDGEGWGVLVFDLFMTCVKWVESMGHSGE